MPALRHAYPSITPDEVDDMPWADLAEYIRFEPMTAGGDRG